MVAQRDGLPPHLNYPFLLFFLQCPEDLRPMKDGTGCYDYSKGIDCSDGFNGGCEQLCLQQTLPLLWDPTSSTIHMFCGCVEEYKMAPDGKSCLLLSDICEGPKCLKPDVNFNDTLFGEMLHGYNNRTQHVNQGQVFQMTFRMKRPYLLAFLVDYKKEPNGLRAFKGALMSSYWCSGKGDVVEDWCRCDLNAFDENGLPSCSALPQPVLRLSPNVEPSSTVVSLEWYDVQPAIGTKVSDYILHHKKVDEYTDTDLYTGESLSFADDLLSGLGTACVAAGRTHRDGQDASLYSVIFKCLEPDGLYKFTLYAVDTRGRHSELSTITLRTACPLVDDTKAEEIADKIYNLYNGYTSGKEQQTAYNTLMEVSASMLSRVQHHYNSHYEKFGDFVWRSEDELGPRKAHLILRRLEKVSKHCSSLLRSAYIQSRTDTMPYLFCRSEEERSQGMVWYNVLKDTKITCEEKMISLLRNMYGDSKGR
ncbi:astrotactin-2-like [Notechis scutatus]|uniref:Astrotactin-2 n=1 Tax=Notechis scutatus TaxID=8663 RepID=A0A6J1VP04_9SAUR|nr:astrotactin-2-like [Notechis scutatus]